MLRVLELAPGILITPLAPQGWDSAQHTLHPVPEFAPEHHPTASAAIPSHTDASLACHSAQNASPRRDTPTRGTALRTTSAAMRSAMLSASTGPQGPRFRPHTPSRAAPPSPRLDKGPERSTGRAAGASRAARAPATAADEKSKQAHARTATQGPGSVLNGADRARKSSPGIPASDVEGAPATAVAKGHPIDGVTRRAVWDGTDCAGGDAARRNGGKDARAAGSEDTASR